MGIKKINIKRTPQAALQGKAIVKNKKRAVL